MVSELLFIHLFLYASALAQHLHSSLLILRPNSLALRYIGADCDVVRKVLVYVRPRDVPRPEKVHSRDQREIWRQSLLMEWVDSHPFISLFDI